MTVIKQREVTDILTWDESKKVANFVHNQGIEQFINIYNRYIDRDGDPFKWGDEIEYLLIKFDNEDQAARLALISDKLLKILKQKREKNPNDVKTLWCSEVGRFMLESSPAQPFDEQLSSLNLVEASMKIRRQEIAKLLAADECMMTLTNFPRAGAPKFTWPILKPSPNCGEIFSRSKYYPDNAIYPHRVSYKAWIRNIRERRGEKVKITPSIFKDANTQIPVDGAPADKPDAVYMDASCFGFGCCALQVTFQGSNSAEARTIYDQLSALAPIMLALTAAAPAFRGYLVDSDTRWNVLGASGDCRTAEERGEAPLKDKKYRIPKSRYSSVESYLSAEGGKYNDVPLVYDNQMYQQLRNGGVDHLMAQHVALLFVRDPIFLYKDRLYDNDEYGTYHYYKISSMNWHSVRLKHPMPDSNCGWRVEFRPCEVQLTDFDNAAIACFMSLLTRVILSHKLNFLIPMSKVDENFEIAQKRNACHAERFWFRKNIFGNQMNGLNGKDSADDQLELMTMNEIFNGNGSTFPGLIPLINNYLSKMDIDKKTYQTIQRYLQLIQGRTSGELLTVASWIRQEIINHPEYKQDSVVSERINFDLMKKVKEIQEGKRSCYKLYGLLKSFEVNDEFFENRFHGNY